MAQSPPTITSFSTTSGFVGTSVTLTGSNFSPTPANNIVYFGAVKATVTAATATSLTVTVPTGATYAPVSVTVNSASATSPSCPAKSAAWQTSLKPHEAKPDKVNAAFFQLPLSFEVNQGQADPQARFLSRGIG